MDTSECTYCRRSHLWTRKFMQFHLCQHVYVTTSFQNAERQQWAITSQDELALGHPSSLSEVLSVPAASCFWPLPTCRCLLGAGITVHSPFWIQKPAVVTAASALRRACQAWILLTPHQGPDPSQQPEVRYTSNVPALSTGGLSQVSCYPRGYPWRAAKSCQRKLGPTFQSHSQGRGDAPPLSGTEGAAHGQCPHHRTCVQDDSSDDPLHIMGPFPVLKAVSRPLSVGCQGHFFFPNRGNGLS